MFILYLKVFCIMFRLSLAEKMQLFQQKQGSKATVREAAPVTRRRKQRLQSRFRTQVTVDQNSVDAIDKFLCFSNLNLSDLAYHFNEFLILHVHCF